MATIVPSPLHLRLLLSYLARNPAASISSTGLYNLECDAAEDLVMVKHVLCETMMMRYVVEDDVTYLDVSAARGRVCASHQPPAIDLFGDRR